MVRNSAVVNRKTTGTGFIGRQLFRGAALLAGLGLLLGVTVALAYAEGPEPTPVPIEGGGSEPEGEEAPTPTLPAPSSTAIPASPTPTATATPAWPTNTPTPAPTWTPVPDCADLNEPNEVPGSGAVLISNETITGLTLFPFGDRDFFRLWAKGGVTYRLTTQTPDGVDTRLRVYDPTGKLVAENDDYQIGNPTSEILFRAPGEGWFSVAVDSPAPTEWGCRQYRLVGVDAAPPTSAPQPTAAPAATATPVSSNLASDPYEPNYDFASAANVGVGTSSSLNFNPYPAGASGWDNDFFRLYVKQGQNLMVETTGLAAGLDTNLILYREDATIVGGNDDCHSGELRSCFTWAPDYTGLAYLLVGPAGVVPEPVSAGARAYTLSIKDTAGAISAGGVISATGNSPVGGTGSWSGGSGGGRSSSGAPEWRVTPVTPTETPLPFPTATPVVSVRVVSAGLPTPTPRPMQMITLDLSVFQDQNNNKAQDIDEAVLGMSVRILDRQNNRLLAYAMTDEYGHINMSVAAPAGVRVSIPFLAYTKEVAAPGDDLTVRLPSLRLPSIIP